MNTMINVVRYHLVDWFSYLVIPWGAVAFSLAVNLVIFGAIGADNAHRSGGLATIYVLLFIGGLFSVTRYLPFGLALGLSRRSLYRGTIALALTLAIPYGLALAGLQTIERATGGWGEHLNYFRVAWILDGPWYVSWLTSSVVLALVFAYGIWFGLVYRRWNLPGLVTFSAGQITVLVAVVLIATWTHTWHDLGHFFIGLNAIGFTGVLAILTAALFAGGFATMRRISV